MTSATKQFAQTLRQHAASSRLDKNAAEALRTLMQVQFNILGSDPWSRVTKIDPGFFVDYTTPQRLDDLESIKAMQKAYIQAIQESQPFEDVVGVVATEFNMSGGEGLGQFMTPRDLADLTADLSMAIHIEKFRTYAANGKPIKVADPTGCGTGALILAQLRSLYQAAPDVMPSVFVTGIDLDADMVRMTANQILWSNFIHGGTLGGLKLYCGNALTDGPTTNLAVEFPVPSPSFAFEELMASWSGVKDNTDEK